MIAQSLRNLQLDSGAGLLSSKELRITQHSLGSIIEAESDLQREQDIISRLRFDHQLARFEGIPDAHISTLHWIFETNLVNWLATQLGVFWASGKAGSGKSTLMKYIATNLQTENLITT